MASGKTLGTAYVQIKPTTKGISGEINKALSKGNPGESAGITIGAGLVSKIKKIIAVAGIGEAIKTALEAGGNLQQSFGGLDTIYGDAASQAKQFAEQAASAGISANSYAEQAVSFGAALKQAYGGDLTKAAGAANTAIMDMADNSAKMGTNITDIQNAYQGFAKQNYTMLDNLKLGYGGTKSEMERLLSDAEKISGVHYDISNLGDVYDAIHVIQGELGVTGVAAKEASTTFTGSFGAMKAAAENVVAGLTLGMDVTPALQQLATSISDFVFKNLLPMLGSLIMGLPSALLTFAQAAVPAIIEGFQSFVGQMSEQFNASSIQAAADTVMNFVMGIINGIPTVIANINTVLQNVFQTITDNLPAVLQKGVEMISSLANGIFQNLPLVISSIGQILQSFYSFITANFPVILEQGIQMIANLANGILENLPAVITAIGSILTDFISFISANLPTILEKGFELIEYLAKGIIKNLPAILSAIAQVIHNILQSLANNLPQLLQKGVEMIGQLAAGLIRALPSLVAHVPSIVAAIVSAFGNLIGDFANIGLNMMLGLARGIAGAVRNVVRAALSACKEILDNVKSFFGIHSPSTVFEGLGGYIDAGLANGITGNLDTVHDAVKQMKEEATGEFTSELNVGIARSAASASDTAARTITNSPTINLQIYASDNMDVSELADEVMDRINTEIARGKRAFS